MTKKSATPRVDQARRAEKRGRRAARAAKAAGVAAIGAGVLLHGGQAPVATDTSTGTVIRSVAVSAPLGNPGDDPGGDTASPSGGSGSDDSGSEGSGSEGSGSEGSGSEGSGSEGSGSEGFGSEGSGSGGSGSGSGGSGGAVSAGSGFGSDAAATGDSDAGTPSGGDADAPSRAVKEDGAPTSDRSESTPAPSTPSPSRASAPSVRQPGPAQVPADAQVPTDAQVPVGPRAEAVGNAVRDALREAEVRRDSVRDAVAGGPRSGATGARDRAMTPLPPARSAASTVQAITENVLTRIALAFAGVSPTSASGPLAPPAPAGALLLAQWAFFRRGENPLFNRSPIVTPVQDDPGTGRLTGSVGAVDPDQDRLSYEVVEDPQYGNVLVDENGNYTYVPDPGRPSPDGTDRFTVVVRDNDPGAPGLGRLTAVLHEALSRSHPVLAERLFGAHAVTRTIEIDVPVEEQFPALSVHPVFDRDTGLVTGRLVVPRREGEQFRWSKVGDDPRFVVEESGAFTFTPTAADRAAAATTPGADRARLVVRYEDPATGQFRLFALADDDRTYQTFVPVLPDAGATGAVADLDVGAGSVQMGPAGSDLAYVTDYQAGTVTIVDTTTGRATTVPVGASPGSPVFSRDGSLLYVTSSDANTVTVLDARDGHLVRTVAVRPSPYEVRFNADGDLAYVVDGNGGLTVVETTNHTVVRTYTDARQIWFSDDGSRAFLIGDPIVTGDIQVVDTARGEIVGSFHAYPQFGQLVLSSDGSRAFWMRPDPGGHVVEILDTTSGERLGSLLIGQAPGSVHVSPDGTRTMVLTGDGRAFLIDSATGTEVAPAVAVGTGPYRDVTFGPDGRAWVTTAADGTPGRLTVVDLADGTSVPLTVGTDLQAPRFSPDGKRAFVIGGGTVTVVDTATTTVVGEPIAVGDAPLVPSFSPDGRLAFTGDFEGTTITVIDVASGASTSTDIGHRPAMVRFSPDTPRAYVAHYPGGGVTVVDTTTGEVVELETPVDRSYPAVDISPDGRYAHLRSDPDENGRVTFISTADDSVTTVDVRYPSDVWFSADGRYAYVLNSDEGRVTIILLGDGTGGAPRAAIAA